MAKSVHNDVLDAALSLVKTNGNLMTVCSAEPTTRAEAVTTYALADVALAPTDLIISDGDVSGRKLAVAAKNNVLVDSDGTATHIAIVDGSRLLYVTTCTSQPLVTGNEVNFPSWDIEIADPT